LVEAIELANERFFDATRATRRLRGMGTTIVAAAR
jgi:hypothetical protein